MSDSHTGFTRSDEWFESHGVRCAAAVYRPNSSLGTSATKTLGLKTPAVVMGHGFGTPPSTVPLPLR